MKFLIVDDSRIARKRLTDYLVDLGHQVVGEASDGLEAVEKFWALNPDIVIIDFEMPKMKGNEASKKILEINPETNIILATSIVDKKEILVALNIGIKKVIKKPFSKEELEDAINKLKG